MTDYFRPDYTPEWFYLENYKPLKDMGREEIGFTIRKRWTLYHLVATTQHLKSADVSLEIFKKITSLDNLADIKIFDNIAVRDFSFSDYLMLQESNEWLGLTPLLGELRESQKSFFDYKKLEPRTVYNETGKINPVKTSSLLKIQHLNKIFGDDVKSTFDIGRPLPFLLSSLITINLSHNDDKIIDDMREWLKSQRDNQAKKRLSDNDIKKIVDNQIIPCMDLLFWAELKEIDYTNAQLGDMLFPNADFDRTEKVRKATRKEATKYLATNAYSHIL